MALNISGLVWGNSTTRQGKQVFYLENIAILMTKPVEDAERLQGRRVMFLVRYSGKGALFYGLEYMLINEGG